MILVTGGTGLVGSHLLYDLVRSGKKVRSIKRSSSNIKNVEKVFSYYTDEAASLVNKIEWIDADLMDIHALNEAFKDIAYVYHCAAVVSFEPHCQDEMMRFNIEGTANLVNIALENKIKRFCYVSSVATLGKEENQLLITEEMFWKNSPDKSGYAISKYGAEREVWRACEEGLNVVIVNPSIIIGAGNWKQSSSNMFQKAFKGIKFYTDGMSGFIDVRDVSALMIKLMDSNVTGHRFILNSENITFRTYFNRIHEAFEKPLPFIKAGKFLSGFAWRIEKLRQWLTGAPPLITKETARSAHRINNYSNQKIKTVFPDFEFITVAASVKATALLFLKDQKQIEHKHFVEAVA